MIALVRCADGRTEVFHDATSVKWVRGCTVVGKKAGDFQAETHRVRDAVSVEMVDPASVHVSRLDNDWSRVLVEAWVRQERANHAVSKYGRGSTPREALIDDMITHPAFHGEWYTFLTNYLVRAQMLRLDRPEGVQALLKALVVLTHCVETAVMVYGAPPAPGDSTAGAQDWDWPTRLDAP